jgi:hypothetical protein
MNTPLIFSGIPFSSQRIIVYRVGKSITVGISGTGGTLEMGTEYFDLGPVPKFSDPPRSPNCCGCDMPRADCVCNVT